MCGKRNGNENWGYNKVHNMLERYALIEINAPLFSDPDYDIIIEILQENDYAVFDEKS